MKNDNENYRIISKSQLKRDSQFVVQLGKRLTTLSPTQLASIPLDESARAAIELAHKIQNKRSALKRQLLFLGKLLRSHDIDTIIAAVERFDSISQTEMQHHRLAEHWRDEIIEQGFTAIEDLAAQQMSVDRQVLRQLWRNYSRSQSEQKKRRTAHQIYQNVRLVLDQLNS